jgi:hypothetical protein
MTSFAAHATLRPQLPPPPTLTVTLAPRGQGGSGGGVSTAPGDSAAAPPPPVAPPPSPAATLLAELSRRRAVLGVHISAVSSRMAEKRAHITSVDATRSILLAHGQRYDAPVLPLEEAAADAAKAFRGMSERQQLAGPTATGRLRMDPSAALALASGGDSAPRAGPEDRVPADAGVLSARSMLAGGVGHGAVVDPRERSSALLARSHAAVAQASEVSHIRSALEDAVVATAHDVVALQADLARCSEEMAAAKATVEARIDAVTGGKAKLAQMAALALGLLQSLASADGATGGAAAGEEDPLLSWDALLLEACGGDATAAQDALALLHAALQMTPV